MVKKIDLIVEKINISLEDFRGNHKENTFGYTVYEKDYLGTAGKKVVIVNSLDGHFYLEYTFFGNCDRPTKIVGIADDIEQANEKAYNYAKNEMVNTEKIFIERAGNSLGKIIEKIV